MYELQRIASLLSFIIKLICDLSAQHRHWPFDWSVSIFKKLYNNGSQSTVRGEEFGEEV